MAEKIDNLDDITPIVELYYHTAKAGQYEDAIKLYKNQLNQKLRIWFGAFQIIVELLQLLFPRGLNEIPCLQKENDQAYVLDELGQAYIRLGQTRLASHAYNQAVKIAEMYCNKEDLGSYKCDLAVLLMAIGKLKDAEKYLKHPIRGSQKNLDQLNVSLNYARLLKFKGSFAESSFIFNEITKNVNKSDKPEHALCIIFKDKADLFMKMNRPSEAYEAAAKSLLLCNKISEKRGPYENDRINSEWMIGQSLIYKSLNSPDKRDELLLEAELHLKEAIIRCHNINLVATEPNILLAIALWHYVKGEINLAKDLSNEALYIANRCESRLDQAEIHNFLAQVYLDQDDKAKAVQHAQIAFECAWCDGPPYCYKLELNAAKELLGKLGVKEPEPSIPFNHWSADLTTNSKVKDI